jgi:hypothetical protein
MLALATRSPTMARRRSLELQEEFLHTRHGPLALCAVYEQVLPVRRALVTGTDRIKEEHGHDRSPLRTRLLGSAGATGHD